MALIEEIKQKIDALGEGEFQALCDAFLSDIGYSDLVSLGTKSGTNKTTKGTPDTYIPLQDGKYIFAEYTVQKTRICQKIKDDLQKCFNENETGIECSKIVKVLYFHTSSNLTPKQDKEIHDLADKHNVSIELTGIDKFANVLYNGHKHLIKQYLGISISTDQIFTKDMFVKKYDTAPTAAPLQTNFMFRENELKEIKSSLSEVNAILISGHAGIGKTRLVLEAAEQYAIENNFQLWIVRNNNENIWDDLHLYFEQSGRYIIIVDDANEIGNLKTYLEFLRDRSDSIKIIITVRKYALDDVSTKLDSTMDNRKICIEKLTNEEIEKLIAENFDLNSIALEKISELSNGNPRIAFLAAKLASETNKISSLTNISELYRNYYGTFLREQEIDKTLFICAGIIAFVKRLNLDTIINFENILEICSLTVDSFIDSVHKLHSLEIVDLYKNKGVKYSDQCLSDFILYYVFIEKKYIGLSAFTKLFFEKDEDLTTQSINTLTNNFYDEENYKFVKSEMKAVWGYYNNHNQHIFEKFFMRFHAMFPIESLSIINDIIERTEIKPIEAEELKAKPNYNRYTENWLDVLASYNNNYNIEEYKYAVELYLMYYLKCPADYDNIISYGKQLCGITKPHILYTYYDNQVAFVNMLIEKSEKWKNRYITILFLDLSENLLKVNFEQTESKNEKFVFIHGTIPYSEKLTEYRKIVWQEIIDLSQDKSNSSKIIHLLCKYGNGFEDKNIDILKFDLPYITRILDNLVCFNSLESILAAERIQMICNSLSLKTDNLEHFFQSEKYQLYHLLENKHREIDNWDERKKQKLSDIKNYLQSQPKTAMIDMIDFVYELQGIEKANYEITESMACAFDCAYDNREIFLDAVKYYLKIWNLNDIVSPQTIVSKLFDYLDDNSVKEIIESANDEIKNNWWFAYFYELPEKLVDEKKCGELLSFLEERTDLSIKSSPYRRMDFVHKYEKYDQDIFFKSCEIILQKKEYYPFMLKIYFDLLFNPYAIRPSDLILKFSNHIELLASIYFEMITDNNFDYSGEYFIAIYQVNPLILDEYLMYYKNEKNKPSDKMLERLIALLNLESYLEPLDKIMNILFDIPFIYMTLSSLFSYNSSFKNNDITEKLVIWIKHYIDLYSTDDEKMRLIFEMNSNIELNSRIDVIKYFVHKNKNIDSFKNLPLFPSSGPWSESQLPLIQSRIDFLTNLKSQLTEISLLKHKAYINEYIDDLNKYKEKVEIDEMIGNR